MSASNSISQLLEQFLELNTNSLETFERINEAITTNKETVTINLYDSKTQQLKPIQIPAFGFLKREIERIDQNIRAISGLDTSSANLRLKDGSFRPIHTAKLKSPSVPVTSLSAPTKFNTKLNEFFEDFLNPLLTINLDVTGQIPVETEKVYVERYIFDSSDLFTSQSFDELYKGANSLVYETFITELSDGGYKHYIDAEVVDMPIRKVQYKGTFDVSSISSEQKSQVVDGVTQTKTVKLFTLNKLTYSDTTKTLKDTEVLKVGDSLVVNSGNYSTRYKVLSIDSSTSQVELQLVEGYEAIKIGASQLTIYKDIETNLEIEIKIGFNERQVIFVKPIDPNSKIPSDEYSPGIGFYSNELQIVETNGTTKSLATYYRDEVADFGEFIKALKVDYIPSAAVGLTPNIPTLNTENFKVVQINKHLTDNSTTTKIAQLKNDKLSAEQSLKKLDDAIKTKRSLLSTKKFSSTIERDKQQNELNTLISQRDSEAKLYSSIVTEIKASAESTNVAAVSPKFRVRGFWSIPEPRKVGQEVSQEVVQFKIRYRYVSTSGKTSQIEQIQFNDTTNQTTKTAAFSNWVEVNGPVRKRQLGTDGKYTWIVESEEDAQAVNFNSLDIAIQSGEIVELMVKSISEAGFPSNPVESDWSEIIKIEFPEGELSGESLSDVVNQNTMDSVKVEIASDLESRGLNSHLADSFNSNEKYFAHTATSLASGFLSAEQNPISVYDKLVEMQNEIDRLRAQITGAVGELVVEIVDEEGNVTLVKNHTTIQLFAGYYVNEVPTTNYKGYIVTKNYKIQLSNNKATDLELISRLIGDVNSPAYVSTTETSFGRGTGSIESEVINNTYYTTEGMYDLVPVSYQNLTATDLSSYTWFNESNIQSTQVRGQFAYSRFKNLANDDAMYVMSDLDSTDTSGFTIYEYGLTFPSLTGVNILADGSKSFAAASLTSYTADGSTADFIWSGTYDVSGNPEVTTLNTVTTTRYDNGILMHKSHPLLQNGVNSVDALEIVGNGLVGLPKTTPRRSTDENGKKQTAFKIVSTINHSHNVATRSALKNSFSPEDQYLLGGHSCGSFLYVAPLTKDALVVDSSNKFGKKRITGGGNNTVTINMVFQYRMTDYNDTITTGRVGGVVGNTLTNLTYSKKIGIDILDSNNNEFQFDVEVYAKYKAEGTTVNNITKSMLSNWNTSGSGISLQGRKFITSDNDFSSPISYINNIYV